VKLYYAYSMAKGESKGCRHVQERLWEEREEMVDVFNRGAKLYVCGSAMVGEGVASVVSFPIFSLDNVLCSELVGIGKRRVLMNLADSEIWNRQNVFSRTGQKRKGSRKLMSRLRLGLRV